MHFFKQQKGKIFMLIFVFFTIYVIFDTYNIQSEAKVNEKPKIENIEKEEKKQTTNVLVDVKGEVNTPGVYELTKENTVMDAINKAGGLTKKSDTSNINLSKKLEDEMVIIVYSKEEIKKMETKTECPTYNDACVCEDDEKSKLDNQNVPKAQDNQKSKTKININTADLNNLQTLNGIGESKAKAIIEYREKNGNFKTIEDIKNVPGIGDSTYENIKNNITV